MSCFDAFHVDSVTFTLLLLGVFIESSCNLCLHSKEIWSCVSSVKSLGGGDAAVSRVLSGRQVSHLDTPQRGGAHVQEHPVQNRHGNELQNKRRVRL